MFSLSGFQFFFKPFVTILVALFITGIIIHFISHICCTYVHNLLCFNFISALFSMICLSTGIATSISMHVFCLSLFKIIIFGLFAITSLSVCTP